MGAWIDGPRPFRTQLRAPPRRPESLARLVIPKGKVPLATVIVRPGTRLFVLRSLSLCASKLGLLVKAREVRQVFPRALSAPAQHGLYLA